LKRKLFTAEAQGDFIFSCAKGPAQEKRPACSADPLHIQAPGVLMAGMLHDFQPSSLFL
jgi:hypothetical protein